MIDSFMEMEVPTGVEEDHDDMNDVDILGFIDDDIDF
jgi:histidinol phosphatase-like PHP family hydrolase